MPISNFPKGFSSGVNVQGFNALNTYSTGQRSLGSTDASGVWWVDGVNGLDGNKGTYSLPFKTLARALVVAQAYDIICIKPGHTESITSATYLTTSANNVTILGFGQGRLRPYFTLNTANTATVNIANQGTIIQNCVFDGTGFAAVASVFTVTAADFQLLNSEVVLGNSTNQAVTGITTTAAASGMILDNNRFTNDTTAGTTSVTSIVGGDRIQISNNWMQGPYASGTGAISNITTATTNALVVGNFINNVTASSTKAITMVAGSTGLIANNRMQILSGSAPITAAGMSWVGGNYYAATIATLGTLI